MFYYLMLQSMGAGNDREAYILELLEDGKPIPELPEPYSKLLQTRRYGVMWYDGGLYNQPVMMLEEFNACIAGEQDFNELQAANQRIKGSKDA